MGSNLIKIYYLEAIKTFNLLMILFEIAFCKKALKYQIVKWRFAILINLLTSP